MRLEPGDSYWDNTTGSSKKHLYFVLGVDSISDRLVAAVVNISSNNIMKEQTCVLQPGEHEQITHESMVYYRGASIIIHDLLLDDIKKGTLKKSSPASRALLDKLIEGAKRSRFIPKEVKDLMIKLYR